MALTRIRCSKDLPVILTRVNHGVTTVLGPARPDPLSKPQKSANLHVSGVRRYPEAPRLPLPGNMSEIFSNETGRFTPERVRDITTPVMLYGSTSTKKTWDNWTSSSDRGFWDSHVDSYDCFGAVSLNGAMQTNVPHPCKSTGKGTHMNMPGGQWVQNGKYIADMQKSHYDVIRQNFYNGRSTGIGSVIIACYSTNAAESPKVGNEKLGESENKLSSVQKLKIAVKDYGSTVVVFHVGISLLSLGAFYAIVSSGLDLTSLIKMLPIGSERVETIMTGSSTFIVAYAVHKVFAPVRISITLGATPFIVRYLRQIGILKMPKT